MNSSADNKSVGPSNHQPGSSIPSYDDLSKAPASDEASRRSPHDQADAFNREKQKTSPEAAAPRVSPAKRGDED